MSWNVQTGQNQINEYRNSSQCFIRRAETPLIADIEQRIANITHTKVEQGENLQVAKYEKNQHYFEHFDYFDVNFVSNESQLRRGGQRQITAMCYLKQPEKGGGTYFPKLGSEQLRGHRFMPIQGRLLIWWNVIPDGRQDESTLHIGEDVEQGTKIIFTKWLRQNVFT